MRDDALGSRHANTERTLRSVGTGLLSGPNTPVKPTHTTTYVRECTIASPPSQVIDFCLSAAGFHALMPDRVESLRDISAPELGAVYEFRWWMRNLVPFRWAAYIDHYEPGFEFADLQLRGPFRYFRHTHTCSPTGTGTRYRDHIEYATALGGWFDRTLVHAEMNALFTRRHQRMRWLLSAR